MNDKYKDKFLFFFFKGKLKLQNHSSFSPAVSLQFSAIDHQNFGIMAALVRAPLSQCISIALTQERNYYIFLLLPCTNGEVHMLMKSQNPDTKHIFLLQHQIPAVRHYNHTFDWTVFINILRHQHLFWHFLAFPQNMFFWELAHSSSFLPLISLCYSRFIIQPA